MSVPNGTININNFLRNEVEWMYTGALEENTAKQNTSYFFLHSTAVRSRILWQDHRLARELERMNERQNDGVERQRRGSWGRSGGNLKVLCYGRANINSNRSDLFPLNVICCLYLLRALLEFPKGNGGAT